MHVLVASKFCNFLAKTIPMQSVLRPHGCEGGAPSLGAPLCVLSFSAEQSSSWRFWGLLTPLGALLVLLFVLFFLLFVLSVFCCLCFLMFCCFLLLLRLLFG